MQRWSSTAERKTGRKKRNLKEREEYLGKGEISGKKKEYQGERRIPRERGNIKEKRGISGRKKNTWGKGKYQGKKGNIMGEIEGRKIHSGIK